MRPLVVVATLLLAVAIYGLALLVSRTTHHPVAIETPANAPVAQAETSQPSAPPPAPALPQSPPPAVNNDVPPPAPVASQETNNAENVHDRVAQLMALAMNDDADSLNAIWSGMTNQDKDIRAGALAALVQFGDSSVTPRLRELAAQTEDPREKLDILAAADQLELPPMSSLPDRRPPKGSP